MATSAPEPNQAAGDSGPIANPEVEPPKDPETKMDVSAAKESDPLPPSEPQDGAVPVTNGSGSTKAEHVWHDVAIVKATSLTVSHYLEKTNVTESDQVDVVSVPEQVNKLQVENKAFSIFTKLYIYRE